MPDLIDREFLTAYDKRVSTSDWLLHYIHIFKLHTLLPGFQSAV